MIRVLMLTSTIGFLAKTCWMKMVAAQIIALVFLVVFMVYRPYRKKLHFQMQMVAMAVPVASMAWGLAGGWEATTMICRNRDEEKEKDALTYDAVIMLALHLAMVVPPALMALFSVLSMMWTLTKAWKHRLHDLITTKAVFKAAVAAKRAEKKTKKKKEIAALGVDKGLKKKKGFRSKSTQTNETMHEPSDDDLDWSSQTSSSTGSSDDSDDFGCFGDEDEDDDAAGGGGGGGGGAGGAAPAGDGSPEHGAHHDKLIRRLETFYKQHGHEHKLSGVHDFVSKFTDMHGHHAEAHINLSLEREYGKNLDPKQRAAGKKLLKKRRKKKRRRRGGVTRMDVDGDGDGGRRKKKKRKRPGAKKKGSKKKGLKRVMTMQTALNQRADGEEVVRTTLTEVPEGAEAPAAAVRRASMARRVSNAAASGALTAAGPLAVVKRTSMRRKSSAVGALTQARRLSQAARQRRRSSALLAMTAVNARNSRRVSSLIPVQEASAAAAAAAGGDASALPPNWAAAVDEASGKTYFYNAITEERTWTRPDPRWPENAQ